MAKSRADEPLSGPSPFRALPSVERVLSAAPFASLIAEFGRALVKSAVVEHLALLRSSRGTWDEAEAASAIAGALTTAVASPLRRVINGSGVIIHTNLGRAPIDERIWAEAGRITVGYSNLELDLATGARGARDGHLVALCRALFGCEAAVLTNNNAAGTMLLLAAMAGRREVLVSRGELVEIGGSFRIPDVIQQGGATLKEVGTTNRTRASDYASAISRRTAALLRVHRSNFDIVGFTETPSIEELVEVSRARRIPLLYDEGSGRAVDLARYGFQPEPTIAELFAAGVDAVTCSTDKLLGASQGGLILGSEEIVERCRRHPLMRAVRAGKESYALIAATLRAFLTARHEELIPIYRMLATPIEELRARAERIISASGCHIVESRSALGGGTTPTQSIPSLAVEVPGNATANQERFLANDPPIIGRIENDRFGIDVRTVFEREVVEVARAVAAGGAGAEAGGN